MATGPTSPNRRMKLNTSFRNPPVPAPAPRSTPSSAIQPSIPQEAWNGTYTPVSATIERSPSISDVSPVTSSMRWTPAHPQLSPPVTEPERMMQPLEQSIDPAVQQPVGYSYIVNNSAPPVHYQGEAPIGCYPPTTTPPPPITEYHPRHSSAQMAPSPAYSSYPTHQEYIAPSPHEEHGMSMMHSQPQHLMYNMPPNMKTEQ